MISFPDLLQQGAANAWLFVPSAVLLGALHGLEPGHSKTMMAAFIVAVRGTPAQAGLLGFAATVSHTVVVWAVALAGLHFGAEWNTERSEPYFQLASAAAIIAVALWMIWRVRRDRAPAHEHRHHDETRRFDLDGSTLTLSIEEAGAPPRWRLAWSGPALTPADATLTTTRPGGERQSFAFVARGGYLESANLIPEPHAFVVTFAVRRDGRVADFAAEFQEGGDAHDHAPEHAHGHGLDDDAHARAHADDIARRFAGGGATTGQIVLFGLTGGLIPCPASITILMLCLQLKRFALGASLVLCFSLGLAITLVGVGVAAALGARQASARLPAFEAVVRNGPYLSAALIIAVGLYTGALGWAGLAAAG